MYNEQGKIVDRRELLKVKVKSLAAEARIIRHAETKTKGRLREELHLHRVNELRRAARNTHVAYALIRGRTLQQVEPNPGYAPDWSEVERMVKKYGPSGYDLARARSDAGR